MSNVISVSVDNWNDEVYKQKCICGHELYLHAFIMLDYDEEIVNLRTSQCTRCDWIDGNTCECECFRKV